MESFPKNVFDLPDAYKQWSDVAEAKLLDLLKEG